MFSKSLHRVKEFQEVMNQWSCNNLWRSVRSINGYLAATLCSLLFFDMVIFGADAELYLPGRLILVGISVLALGLVGLKNHDVNRILMVAVPYAWCMTYFYFINITPENFYSIVIGGSYFAIFAMSLLMHRFSTESVVFHLASVSSLLVLSFVRPEFFMNAVQFILCHSVSYSCGWIFRREFHRNLYEKYDSLQKIHPKKLAMMITATEYDIEKIEQLRPKQRQVISLCSDWRGYQSIVSQVAPEKMQQALVWYYEFVWDSLEENIQHGLYFREWIADELVVTFYSENEAEFDLLKEEVARFAIDLATEINRSVNDQIPKIEIIIDIGISIGQGQMGLMGPIGSKKPTIIGPSPGVAKRLEQEAKRQRMEWDFSAATIAMDADFGSFFDRSCHNDGTVYKVTAKSKDLLDQSIFIWNVGASIDHSDRDHRLCPPDLAG